MEKGSSPQAKQRVTLFDIVIVLISVIAYLVDVATGKRGS